MQEGDRILEDFGEHLRAHANPEWGGGYVDWAALEECIAANTAVRPGVVVRPELVTRSFVDFLEAQITRVNTFFTAKEAELVSRWRRINLASCATTSEAPTLSVLQTHMQKKCKAKPGQCPALQRLEKGLDQSDLAKFVLLYDGAMCLQQLVVLNHLAFSKGLDAFEAISGMEVKAMFSSTLQQAQFYNSSGLPRLVTAMECGGKEVHLRANSQQVDEALRDEYTCGVCLEVLRNPVVLSCAHRFCWHCAASSCVTSSSCSDWACPTCRKTQPVREDVFTVNTQLQSFIQEHLLQSPATPSLLPLNGDMPDDAGWADFRFTDIVQRKEDAQRSHVGDGEGDEDDVWADHLPVLGAEEFHSLERAVATQSRSPELLPPPPPPPPPQSPPHFGAWTADQKVFVGEWHSLDDGFDFETFGGAIAKPATKAARKDKAKMPVVSAARKQPSKLSHAGRVKPVAAAATARPSEVKSESAPYHTPTTLPTPSAMGTGTESREVAVAATGVPPKRKRGRPPVKEGLTDEQRRLNRLKKNRIAAQKSYRKRVKNTCQMEEEYKALREGAAFTVVGLDKACEQWKLYAEFVKLHGLTEAATAAGLLAPVTRETLRKEWMADQVAEGAGADVKTES